MKVLRPELFKQLKKHFGEHRVKVSKQGQEIVWGLRTDTATGKTHRVVDKTQGHDWGEYYRVCCPYCGDKKYRLSINHMWGHLDPLTGSRNLWLIECHHQKCLADWEQQKWFYVQLMTAEASKEDTVEKGKVAATKAGQLYWPGTIWPVNKLVEDHPARLYLESRHFDCDWLVRQFQVGYLLDVKPKYRFLRDRIIIPIFAEGETIGWQARIAHEAKPGELKYISMQGMPRASTLYNFDSAKQYSHVIVVEGPTDVWRTGPDAVAVLGKPSGMQTHMLATHWKKIIVLLDEDAKRESEDLLNILKRTNPVVEVRLPESMDPGDFSSTAELRDYIGKSLVAQHFEL